MDTLGGGIGSLESDVQGTVDQEMTPSGIHFD